MASKRFSTTLIYKFIITNLLMAAKNLINYGCIIAITAMLLASGYFKMTK